MFVNAEIITDSLQAMALPNEAVVPLEGSNYVLLSVGNGEGAHGFLLKKVQVGNRYNGYTQILNPNDFETGDQFLIRGGFQLLGEAGGEGH